MPTAAINPTTSPTRIVSEAIKLVSERTGYSRAALLGYARPEDLSRCRQTVYWLSSVCGVSGREVANRVGRDAGTVSHGIRKMIRWHDIYPDTFGREMDSMRSELVERLTRAPESEATIKRCIELVDSMTPGNVAHLRTNVRCMLSGLLEK